MRFLVLDETVQGPAIRVWLYSKSTSLPEIVSLIVMLESNCDSNKQFVESRQKRDGLRLYFDVSLDLKED